MPPASRISVTAPPSNQATRAATVARAKQLRSKGNGRSPQESQELIDNLLALLPPGTLN